MAASTAAERFIDKLKLWYLATSLGGVESTVSYPVLSSHIGLSAKQLELLGVSPATIRLSVGIEDAGDLIADLEQALARGSKPRWEVLRQTSEDVAVTNASSHFVDPEIQRVVTSQVRANGESERVVSQ